MFKTILVPTDGSPLSRRAEDAAIAYAAATGAALVAVCVAEPAWAAGTTGSAFASAGFDPRELLAVAQSRAEAVAGRARAASVPCQSSSVLSYYPHEEILRAAADYRCDAIFMATHGIRGIRKVLLGSETQKVLAHATLPVLVFR